MKIENFQKKLFTFVITYMFTTLPAYAEENFGWGVVDEGASFASFNEAGTEAKIIIDGHPAYILFHSLKSNGHAVTEYDEGGYHFQSVSNDNFVCKNSITKTLLGRTMGETIRRVVGDSAWKCSFIVPINDEMRDIPNLYKMRYRDIIIKR